MRLHYVLFLLCLVMVAGEPNKEARSAAKDNAYRGLVQQFGVPKAYWNRNQVDRVPGLLRSDLYGARDREEATAVLGQLDLIDDLDSLSPEEKLLLAQVAWSESFYKEGVKQASDTPLEPLFKALDRERRGKPAKGQPSSLDLIRQDGFRVIKENVSWRPLRKALLEPVLQAVLADPRFLYAVTLPPGFDPDWLKGARGVPAFWDKEWQAAWVDPEPSRLAKLMIQMSYYRPEGLDPAQTEELGNRLQANQGLPYLWASQDAPLVANVLPAFFCAKVRVAELPAGAAAEAAKTLAPLANQPRDFYELSRLRETLGTERDLKLILDQEKELLNDPGLPGWSTQAARERLGGIRVRYDSLVSARKAEENKAAEAARKAEAAERKAEEARRIEELRERMEGEITHSVNRSLETLSELVKSQFKHDARGLEACAEHLVRTAATFNESPAMMTLFQQRLLSAWLAGPGQMLASDGNLMKSEKDAAIALVRKTVNGLRAKSGAGTPE